jgi:hypothetical protein
MGKPLGNGECVNAESGMEAEMTNDQARMTKGRGIDQ